MGQLELVNGGSENDHTCNDAYRRAKRDQVIHGGARRVGNTQREIGPPMESIPAIEQQEHAHDLHPVLPCVLVHILVVGVSHVEESTLSL